MSNPSSTFAAFGSGSWSGSTTSPSCLCPSKSAWKQLYGVTTHPSASGHQVLAVSELTPVRRACFRYLSFPAWLHRYQLSKLKPTTASRLRRELTASSPRAARTERSHQRAQRVGEQLHHHVCFSSQPIMLTGVELCMTSPHCDSSTQPSSAMLS